jgi:hypothetical protein
MAALLRLRLRGLSIQTERATKLHAMRQLTSSLKLSTQFTTEAMSHEISRLSIAEKADLTGWPPSTLNAVFGPSGAPAGRRPKQQATA